MPIISKQYFHFYNTINKHSNRLKITDRKGRIIVDNITKYNLYINLSKVVNLKKFPGTVIDVFIEIIQADAGTRCAGLCAASMALAEAGLDMLDLPVAVGVGKYKDKLIVDLDYIEDSDEHGVDVPCAILPSTGEITLLQVDGVISKDELMEALTKVKPAAEHIKEIMVKAIKERYEVAGNKK